MSEATIDRVADAVDGLLSERLEARIAALEAKIVALQANVDHDGMAIAKQRAVNQALLNWIAEGCPDDYRVGLAITLREALK